MQINKHETENPCEIILEITVEAERVGKAVDQAYKNASKQINVPGFRKGKAPRAILQNLIDKSYLKEEVVDILMEKVYAEALDKAAIEPYAIGELQEVEWDMDNLNGEMVVKVKVPLPPVVELGEYKGIDAEKKIYKVKEEDIDAEINKMLESRAAMSQLYDREVQNGDMVLAEMTRTDDEVGETHKEFVKVGENLPDFDNGLIGMNIDDEKEISVSFPEDAANEEMKGKTIVWKVKVLEIHQRELPELNDKWVKDLFAKPAEEGEEPIIDETMPTTVEALKAKMREGMEKSVVDVSKSTLENEIFQKVVDNSTIHFPQVMLTTSVRERLNELAENLKKRKLTIEDYIDYKKTTKEALAEEYEKEEEQAIKGSLVFHKLLEAEEEAIKIEDTDVEQEIKEMAEKQNVPEATIQAYIDSTNSIQSIRSKIQQKKLLEFLVASSNIKEVEQS
jgi:trigger factor